MNVIIGSVGLSRYTGCLSPVYYVLTKRSKDDHPQYLGAYFQTEPFQESLVRIGNGILAHRMRIPMELLKCEPFPRPPPGEQATIVRFLDYANQRIRAYLRQKQKLIALLEEQKQVIIQKAVTGQTNAQTGKRYEEYRDSDVEWLNEVPAHWAEIPLHLATHSIQTGPFGSQLHAEEYVTGGIPVINPAHMQDDTICADGSISVNERKANELSRHRLATDDIVVARRGEIGRCAVVGQRESGWLCGTGSLRIRVDRGTLRTLA